MFHGSLLPSGRIESAAGVVYKTPVAWCRELLGNIINPRSVKKNVAYHRVRTMLIKGSFMRSYLGSCIFYGLSLKILH